jgi:hypothetical protein
MLNNLQGAAFVAITTDFWSDRSFRSYLCMTGHRYDENMAMNSRVLVFTPFAERHTSGNKSCEIENQLKRLNIFDKTTTITCDGASNMKASFKKLDPKIKRLQCLAHKLHLIICNALGLWMKKKKSSGDVGPDGKKQCREECRVGRLRRSSPRHHPIGLEIVEDHLRLPPVVQR